MSVRSKPGTFTELQMKQVFQITIALFFNQAVVPLIVAGGKALGGEGNYYDADGFINDLFMLTLTQIITDPLMKVLNLYGRYIDQSREAALKMLENPDNDEEIAKKAKETYGMIRQGNFHEMFYPPEVQQSSFISNATKMFLFVMMFGVIFPFTACMAAIGFFMLYQTDRQFILRIAKRPRALDDDIIFQSIDFVFQGLIVACAAFPIHLWFISLTEQALMSNGESIRIHGNRATNEANTGATAYQTILIILCIGFSFCQKMGWVPGGFFLRKICNCIIKDVYKTATEVINPETGDCQKEINPPYAQARLEFSTDYCVSYPLTKSIQEIELKKLKEDANRI